MSDTIRTADELQGLTVEEIEKLSQEEAEVLWMWAVPRLLYHKEEAARIRDEADRHREEAKRLRQVVQATRRKSSPPVEESQQATP